jgi:hypothetical protein
MPRFEVGDRVLMRQDSEYYLQCCEGYIRGDPNSSIPRSGVIVSVYGPERQWLDNRKESFVYIIKWDNGEQNNYRESDVRSGSAYDICIDIKFKITSSDLLRYIKDTKRQQESDTDYLKRMFGLDDNKTELVVPAIRHLDLDD